jgi:hypothetical protein
MAPMQTYSPAPGPSACGTRQQATSTHTLPQMGVQNESGLLSGLTAAFGRSQRAGSAPVGLTWAGD